MKQLTSFIHQLNRNSRIKLVLEQNTQGEVQILISLTRSRKIREMEISIKWNDMMVKNLQSLFCADVNENRMKRIRSGCPIVAPICELNVNEWETWSCGDRKRDY